MPNLRRDIEAECLQAFEAVVSELGLPVGGRGYGAANRFDAGFTLVGQQRYQFGDLRVVLEDRVVAVEVESGGGLTNLVKYWPLAEHTTLPLLLIHAFGQGSANDYLSHLLLWDFTWAKMRDQIWRATPPTLFARRYTFSHADPNGLVQAASDFRRCLTESLETTLTDIFGYAEETRGAISQMNDGVK